MGQSQNLQTQQQILSGLMAKKARIEILSWTYTRTATAVGDWRRKNGFGDLGLDYRTMVRIENNQTVKPDSYHHLRKTFEAHGVVFTENDVEPQTIDDRSLKIHGYTRFTGHLHQSVCDRLQEMLASADSKVSEAQLMSRIIDHGIQHLARPEGQS